MGMFDYVEYETKCPKCSETVTDFQSKDGPCVLKALKPKDVRRFYSSCDNCKEWLEYEYIPTKEAEIRLYKPTKKDGE